LVEQYRVVRLLIDRVVIRSAGLEIIWQEQRRIVDQFDT
jgi:hypothetical protein